MRFHDVGTIKLLKFYMKHILVYIEFKLCTVMSTPNLNISKRGVSNCCYLKTCTCTRRIVRNCDCNNIYLVVKDKPIPIYKSISYLKQRRFIMTIILCKLNIKFE